MDSITPWGQPVRYVTGYLPALPQQIAVVPAAVSEWFSESSSTRQELMAENKQLAARNLVLELRSQRLASLEAENSELRELLSASEQVDDRVLVTSVIAVDPKKNQINSHKKNIKTKINLKTVK